jgi:Immunity protein family (Imm11)
MRWYDLIMCSNTVAKPFVSNFDDLKGFEDWQLRAGKRIEDWNPEAWIRCLKPEWNGDPDDVLQTHLAVPIYSPRLQTVIRDARFSGIQFLPIRVLRMDASEIPGFAVANILNIPSAMDMDNSLYDRFEEDYFDAADRGKVAGVYKMVLKRDALTGYDIVRPKEFRQSEYASERSCVRVRALYWLFIPGSAVDLMGSVKSWAEGSLCLGHVTHPLPFLFLSLTKLEGAPR